MNPISRLAQIQQAEKEKEPEYVLLSERGMPRRREFVMQVGSGTCWGGRSLYVQAAQYSPLLLSFISEGRPGNVWIPAHSLLGYSHFLSWGGHIHTAVLLCRCVFGPTLSA